MGIEELKLTLRFYNCLKRAGIDTVEQLCSIPIDSLERIRGLGPVGLTHIYERLEAAKENRSNETED